MIQLCSKDKEKVYQAIRSGNIDAADIALPNLIKDIVLTMKKHGLLDMPSKALPDKRMENHQSVSALFHLFPVTTLTMIHFTFVLALLP